MKNYVLLICFMITAGMVSAQALKVAANSNVGIGVDPTNYGEKFVIGGLSGQFPVAFRIDNSTDGTSNRATFQFGATYQFLLDIGGDGTNNFGIWDGSGFALSVDPSKNIGIGTASPDQKLSVNGNASKTGGGVWETFSDKRLKKNVKSFDDGLDEILKINPVWFQYNGKANIANTDKEYVGIIAQEMQKVAPYTISTAKVREEAGVDVKNSRQLFKSSESTEYLTYNGTAVTYMLVNAAKEQNQIIEALKEDIENLRTRLDDMSQYQNGIQDVELSLDNNSSASSTLSQNAPNPYSDETSIAYNISGKSNSAYIGFFDLSGKVIKTVNVSGKGTLNINSQELPIGSYTYSLVIDGKVVDTHRMVKAK